MFPAGRFVSLRTVLNGDGCAYRHCRNAPASTGDGCKAALVSSGFFF
jgi:hypothetical protein